MYNTFKKKVKESLATLGYEVDQHSMIKVNGRKDGLVFKDKMFPVLYLDELFEQYEPGRDILKMCEDVVTELKSKSLKVRTVSFASYSSPDYILGNVFFQVVNTERNKELLNESPHREFMNLSVIYRCRVDLAKPDEGIPSFIIKNDMMVKLGIAETQLYDAAYENTFLFYPGKIMPMDVLIRRIMMGETNEKLIYGDVIDISNDFVEADDDEWMLCISNAKGIYGATALISSQFLSRVAEVTKRNFYVLPSSIHEMLIVPVVENTYEEVDAYERMVLDINYTQVEPKDFLSDIIYYYDINTGELHMAIDYFLKTKVQAERG